MSTNPFNIAKCEVLQSYFYFDAFVLNVEGYEGEMKRGSTIIKSPVRKLDKDYTD